MDLKNNVECFMRTLSDFHNRIDDFYKLYEARYIADGFKPLIDEIFLGRFILRKYENKNIASFFILFNKAYIP